MRRVTVLSSERLVSGPTSGTKVCIAQNGSNLTPVGTKDLGNCNHIEDCQPELDYKTAAEKEA